MKPNLTFYTRNGCHLCDKAMDIIFDLQNEFEFTIEERNIEEKDEWTERYGLMIPVVIINGKEVQYGPIDRATISGALKELLF